MRPAIASEEILRLFAPIKPVVLNETKNGYSDPSMCGLRNCAWQRRDNQQGQTGTIAATPLGVGHPGSSRAAFPSAVTRPGGHPLAGRLIHDRSHLMVVPCIRE